MNLDSRHKSNKVPYFELYEKLLTYVKKLMKQTNERDERLSRMKEIHEETIRDKDSLFKKLLEDYEKLSKKDNTSFQEACSRII